MIQRKQINSLIREIILSQVHILKHINTRQINRQLADQFNVPKQVVSGNISYLVTSGQVNIMSDRPNSYIYI